MPSRASSGRSPALDVRLAHEIGFQFGHHDADDSDEDEEVYLQGRQQGGWRPSQDAHSPQSSPKATHTATHPNGKENGQPDDEPVIHV